MARIVLTLLVSLLPLVLGVAAVSSLERFAHLDRATSVGLALALILTVYILVNSVRRLADQRAFRARMVDLEILAGNWNGTLGALSGRVAAMEERTLLNPARELKAISAEVERVGALASRLSATIADLERQQEGALAPAAPRLRVIHRGKSQPAEAEKAAGPPLDPDQLAGVAREAISAKRLEMFLQPIVTLPQRRPRYYEALARLRGADQALILPTDFMPAAAKAGLMAEVDNLALFRSVQILRRISARQADVGLFCNISRDSLSDGDFFGEFVGFAHANRGLAEQFIFEMSQEAVDMLGPVELESLGTLAGMGYRFSVDAVTNLNADFEQLAARGFRFVKVPAQTVIERARRRGTPAAGEFSDLLARFGIDLIADRIETEQQVIELLDCDVRLGQGYLFAPPRPVRADVLAAGAVDIAATG